MIYGNYLTLIILDIRSVCTKISAVKLDFICNSLEFEFNNNAIHPLIRHILMHTNTNIPKSFALPRSKRQLSTWSFERRKNLKLVYCRQLLCTSDIVMIHAPPINKILNISHRRFTLSSESLLIQDNWTFFCIEETVRYNVYNN